MQSVTYHTEPRRAVAVVLQILLLLLGSCLGILYCASQGSLLGVIAAALLPGAVIAWILDPARGGRAQGQDEIS